MVPIHGLIRGRRSFVRPHGRINSSRLDFSSNTVAELLTKQREMCYLSVMHAYVIQIERIGGGMNSEVGQGSGVLLLVMNTFVIQIEKIGGGV